MVIWKDGNVLFNDTVNSFYLRLYGRNNAPDTFYLRLYGRKEMFYLTMHSTHFIYGYMEGTMHLTHFIYVYMERRKCVI